MQPTFWVLVSNGEKTHANNLVLSYFSDISTRVVKPMHDLDHVVEISLWKYIINDEYKSIIIYLGACQRASLTEVHFQSVCPRECRAVVLFDICRSGKCHFAAKLLLYKYHQTDTATHVQRY